MKKFLFLTLLSAFIAANSNAQTSSGPAATPQQTKETTDPVALLQQTKEKVRPLMVEKTGLTNDQADKVIEILFEMRQAAASLQGLNEADRSTKLVELKATKDKKLNELLTAEQITAVKRFYEEMGRNNQPKSGN